MDFSKIKKIFYIVAIVSMLLSIKSRVFAATNVSINDFPPIPNDYVSQNFIITKNYDGSDYNLFVLNDTINNNNHVLFINVSPYQLTFPSGSGKRYYTSVNNGNTWTFRSLLNSSNNIDRYGVQISEILLSSVDIYDPTDTRILFQKNYSPEIFPSFDNVTEIKNGYPDGVIISPHDFTENDDLYFHLLRIDNTVPNSDTSVYYYSDHTFLLNKDSDYFRTWNDPSIEGFYYFIPRYNLKLSTDSSYLYVLNNSSEQIQNSFGLYSVDTSKGIYDVVQSDTAGVITSTEEQTDLLKNMEEQSVQNANSINNINNTLKDNTVSSDTETNIDNSLKFDNKNEGLNNLNNGFFSRLTSMLSNLLGYNLSDDTSVSLPLPNSDKSIILHSKDIYDNVAASLRVIINAFWTFIFTFYLWRFINKIYISVTSGNILDSFSSSGEAITNDML